MSGDAFGGGQGQAGRKRNKYYDEFGTALGIYAESNRYNKSLITGTPFYSNKQIASQQKRASNKQLKQMLSQQAKPNKRVSIQQQFYSSKSNKKNGLFSAVNIFKV
jgi:hypothetical protein